VLVPDIAGFHDAVIDREWAKREQIEGFIGHPLRFRGSIVGVYGCIRTRARSID
jgi:hypothetical protein